MLENRSHKVAEKLLFNFISLQKSMDCMMIFNMYFIACLKKKLWNRSLHRKKTWRSKIDLMTFFLHTYVTVRCRYVYSLAIRLENTQPEK